MDGTAATIQICGWELLQKHSMEQIHWQGVAAREQVTNNKAREQVTRPCVLFRSGAKFDPRALLFAQFGLVCFFRFSGSGTFAPQFVRSVWFVTDNLLLVVCSVRFVVRLGAYIAFSS